MLCLIFRVFLNKILNFWSSLPDFQKPPKPSKPPVLFKIIKNPPHFPPGVSPQNPNPRIGNPPFWKCQTLVSTLLVSIL